MNLFYSTIQHFDRTGKAVPETADALLFIVTEVAEATELLMATKPYVRNHPETKEPFTAPRFAEELADVIYMAIVAGATQGVDPLEALERRVRDEVSVNNSAGAN